MSTTVQRTNSRRVPIQARSRAKVAAVLDASADLVVRHGVDALSTRGIAEGAGIPVASLYQYFADKEAVLLALAERDMAEMDEQVATDLATLIEGPGADDLEQVVRSVMGAYVSVYGRRPAFVEIYLRGRGNAAVRAFGREHNRLTATTLHALVIDLGLVPPDLPTTVSLLAVELGDRCFQLAYEHDDAGDPEIIEESMVAITAYLSQHAGGSR